MKSIKAMKALRASRHFVPTGAHCPQSGWWIPGALQGPAPRYLWQGSVMPAVNGQGVTWQLTKADPSGTHAMETPTAARHQSPWASGGSMALWPDCLD